jgi:hypothetical protein
MTEEPKPVGEGRAYRPKRAPAWRGDTLVRPAHDDLERVNPMDYRALSAALADIELTHEGIARFVTDYGFLGPLDRPEARETLALWQKEVAPLRVVWRALHCKPQDKPDDFTLHPTERRTDRGTLYYYDMPGHAGAVMVPDGPIPDRRALEAVLARVISEHTTRLVGAQVYVDEVNPA